MTLYPNVEWLPWKFSTAPRQFWSHVASQRRYMDWLGVQLGYRGREDWYQIRKKDFEDNFGGPMLRMYYDSSPSRCISAVYDDFVFAPWRFQHLAKDFGKKKEDLRSMLEQIEKQYGFSSRDDWYRVTQKQLVDVGVAALLKREGGLVRVLRKVYPENQWDLARFVNAKMNQNDKSEPSQVQDSK